MLSRNYSQTRFQEIRIQYSSGLKVLPMFGFIVWQVEAIDIY